MIINHKLIKKENNDILYLYVDFNYEFSSDNKKRNIQHQELGEKVLNYIKNKKINLKNGTILIVASGIIMGSIIIANNQLINIEPTPNNNYEITETIIVEQKEEEQEMETKLEEQKEEKQIEQIEQQPKLEIKKEIKEKQTQPPKQEIKEEKPTTPPVIEKQITIHRSNGQIINLNLEQYIIGVVGAEMPASFNVEALKAQSIVARTYALKKISKNEKITDTVNDQVYKDNEQLKNIWGNEYNKYYSKIENAVNSTKGEYLSYNNEYIEAVYHSTSNGQTEDAKNVWGNSFPYLISVNSPWDKDATSYLRNETKDFNNLLELTGITFDESTNIEILSKTSGKRIEKIKINEVVFTGVELRNLLGLRSADFDIEINNGQITFTTRGYGHGVGMSQYGANGMANNGYSYKQILNHYYPTTIIKKY